RRPGGGRIRAADQLAADDPCGPRPGTAIEMPMPRSVGLARLWHLTPLIGLVALGILIVYSGERTYREQQADELKVDARILASTMVAALSFEDRAVAD